jgi:hypothetical protein
LSRNAGLESFFVITPTSFSTFFVSRSIRTSSFSVSTSPAKPTRMSMSCATVSTWPRGRSPPVASITGAPALFTSACSETISRVRSVRIASSAVRSTTGMLCAHFTSNSLRTVRMAEIVAWSTVISRTAAASARPSATVG